MQLLTPTTATFQGISAGVPGIKQTLKAMRLLVKEGKKSLNVRMAALKLVDQLPAKDGKAEICALFYFVRDKIRYVKDVTDVETIHTADKMLEIRQGDCDDKSVLLASLLESIGHPSRFVAMSLVKGEFCHVYVETKLGNKWIPLETTLNVHPGWRPPCTEKLVIHNK